MSNQTEFNLREFSINDLDECISLYRQMVDHHREIYEDNTIPYNDEYIREKLQRTDDNYIKMVAEKSKHIVGLLTIDIKGRTCELDEILVDKSMRGKKIGTTFVEYLKKTAIERGCTEIQVSFAARNEKALNFYHRKIGLNCLGMMQIFMPLTDKGKEQWYRKGKKTVFLGLDFFH
jgi:ribosomal protein S18 acetylase RimI-like enzyme